MSARKRPKASEPSSTSPETPTVRSNSRPRLELALCADDVSQFFGSHRWAAQAVVGTHVPRRSISRSWQTVGYPSFASSTSASWDGLCGWFFLRFLLLRSPQALPQLVLQWLVMDRQEEMVILAPVIISP